MGAGVRASCTAWRSEAEKSGAAGSWRRMVGGVAGGAGQWGEGPMTSEVRKSGDGIGRLSGGMWMWMWMWRVGGGKDSGIGVGRTRWRRMKREASEKPMVMASNRFSILV